MNILMLTSVLPGTVPTGGEIVTSAYIDALRSCGHRVVVVGYSRAGAMLSVGEDTLAVGDRVIETASARWRRFAWMLRSIVGRRPYSVAKFESRDYARRIKEIVGSLNPDVIVVEHVQMAWAQRSVRWRVPTVLNAHNVEHEMYRELAALRHGSLTAWALHREARLMERWERASAARATEIWTLTDEDARWFQAASPKAQVRQFDVPASAAAAPAGAEFDIGILGTWTWQPNRAGLEWFLDHVVPLLPEDVDIRVAGRGGEWIARRAPRVQWAGLVPSASAFLHAARVIAVPSVTGGGVQVKTLDAIASGRPVVATSVALRGIRDTPGQVIQSDDPAQFASILRRTLSEPVGTDAAADGIAWTQRRRERFTQAVCDAVASLARTQ